MYTFGHLRTFDFILSHFCCLPSLSFHRRPVFLDHRLRTKYNFFSTCRPRSVVLEASFDHFELAIIFCAEFFSVRPPLLYPRFTLNSEKAVFVAYLALQPSAFARVPPSSPASVPRWSYNRHPLMPPVTQITSPFSLPGHLNGPLLSHTPAPLREPRFLFPVSPAFLLVPIRPRFAGVRFPSCSADTVCHVFMSFLSGFVNVIHHVISACHKVPVVPHQSCGRPAGATPPFVARHLHISAFSLGGHWPTGGSLPSNPTFIFSARLRCLFRSSPINSCMRLSVILCLNYSPFSLPTANFHQTPLRSPSVFPTPPTPLTATSSNPNTALLFACLLPGLCHYDSVHPSFISFTQPAPRSPFIRFSIYHSLCPRPLDPPATSSHIPSRFIPHGGFHVLSSSPSSLLPSLPFVCFLILLSLTRPTPPFPQGSTPASRPVVLPFLALFF